MNRYGIIAVAGLAASLSLVGCTTTTTPATSPGGGGSAPTVAPASPASGGPQQIAFVTNNTANYWNIAKGGVTKAQSELGPGYDVQFIEPSDGSAATQKSDVDDLVAKGVKAIAISPVDPKNQTEWINGLSKTVSVLTQDSDAPNSKRLAYLGTDNHAAGVLAGQLIKQGLPNGGKIMLFVGNRDAQNAKDREQGIRDALAGSKIQILDVRTDNADDTLAKTNAADMMTAHPDLAMEVGLYSYDGPAILSAVTDAHNVGKVKIVCFDQEKATLAGVKSGAIYGTVVQQPFQFGYAATKLLAQLAKGDKSGLPANGIEYFPAKQVTSSNIAAYIAELDKETGQEWGPAT
jgi:ribose transport system substrate-binding protein